jgi:hypothetical protein
LQVLVQKQTTPGQTFAFGMTELGSLPQRRLDRGFPGSPIVTPIWLNYTSPGAVVSDSSAGLLRTTEVDLFLLDPTILDFFSTTLVPFSELVTRPADPLWLELVADRQFAPPALAACSAPGEVGTNGGALGPIDEEIETRDFLGTTLPLGEAAAPGLTGSIKAARVYDHGLCSATAAFGRGFDPLGCGLWVTVADSLYGGFKQSVANTGFPGSELDPIAFSDYTHVWTRLTHSPGRGATQVDDGFTVDFQWGIHYQNDFPAFPTDVNVHGTAVYSLSLDSNGVLSANETGLEFLFATGTGSDKVRNDLNAALTITLPEEFDAAARQAQAVVVPAFPSMCPQQCERVKPDCGPSYNELVNAIAAAQGVLGLSSTEVDDLIASISDSSGLALKQGQWLCAPPPPASSCSSGMNMGGGDTCKANGGTAPDPSTPVCQFVVPAKRLNVYPNEAELVWFDTEEEFHNPAFALFIATFGAPDGSGASAREQLCAFKPEGPFFTRPLGAVSVHL